MEPQSRQPQPYQSVSPSLVQWSLHVAYLTNLATLSPAIPTPASYYVSCTSGRDRGGREVADSRLSDAAQVTRMTLIGRPKRKRTTCLIIHELSVAENILKAPHRSGQV